MFVSGIILAAGESKRFEGPLPKQLLEFQGEPLVRRTARQALNSSLSEVVVVIGHQADLIRKALQNLPVRVAENRRFREGQSTSVRAGIRALSRRSSAVLFAPVDQPFLTSDVIDRLIDAYGENAAQSASPIVVPCWEQRRGAPVLFDRAFFKELQGIAGDEGGRQLQERHPDRVVTVALESEDPLKDIDTPEDYRRLLGSVTK